MKFYLGCIAGFVLGGAIIGYLAFKHAIDLSARFNSHMSYVGYVRKGINSIRTIEYISNQEYDKAIYLLESDIHSARISVDVSDCEICKEPDNETYKMLSEYKFTHLEEYQVSENNPYQGKSH